MIRWPSQQSQQSTAESEWIPHASDEDLETLMAVFDLAGEEPLPEYGLELFDAIRARTQASMKKAAKKKATKQVEVQTATDFRSLLASSWDRADATLRNSLRTVARALGVSVPKEPMRRTRFPEQEDAAALAQRDASRSSPKHASRENPTLTAGQARLPDDNGASTGHSIRFQRQTSRPVLGRRLPFGEPDSRQRRASASG